MPNSLHQHNGKTILPPAITPVPYKRILSIEDIITIDRVVLILSITTHYYGDIENETEVFVINHDDFHAWLDDNEKLVEFFGLVDDPVKEDISYTEYIQCHVQKADYKEYLLDKNLIPSTHVWNF